MDEYEALLVKHGVGFEVTPSLDRAICNAALDLSDEACRADIRLAIERGRFTDGRRQLLILPPDRNVLLGFQDVALTVADGRGAVAKLADSLADRIAKIVGYSKAPRRFRVIYADPPWRYNKFGSKGHGKAEDHYPTMSIEELCELEIDLGWGPRRVRDLADKRGCVLLCWIPAPKIKSGLEVMEAWGFPVVTKGFVWFKTNDDCKDPFFGTGYYTRQSDEDCWFGKIGKVTPKRRDVRREVRTSVCGHSRKPREIYDRIESLWDGPYLELFSRSRRPGWCSFGNDPSVAAGSVTYCPKDDE